MRLGRVEFNIGYVVDLDDPDMVQHAKDSIVDDITNAARDGVFCDIIKDEMDGLGIGDIPDFLWDDGDQYVIYSKTENLFWSNEDGWVDYNSATEFEGHERPTVNMPIPNAEWMNTRNESIRPANPDNDEFNCEECKKCLDIEDSIRDEESKELYCSICYSRKKGLI